MDANANAKANAGGSTIALHELCSGKLKMVLVNVNMMLISAINIAINPIGRIAILMAG